MDAVLDNVSKRAGLGGLTMAAAYHHGRDVFPHNPARKVHFLEGGTVFFQPDSSRYQGRALQPLVSALAQKTDVLADLCHDAAAGRLQRAAGAELENRFGAQPDPERAELDRADLASVAGGELGGDLESRSKSVASLVAECAESAKAEGADFAFIDLSGAIK